MKFLREYKDFIQNFTFKQCPFEKQPIHVTANGCCIGIYDNVQYHIFKKIPHAIDVDGQSIARLFEEYPIKYIISPYCFEPNFIRIMTQLSPDSEYVTSLFTTNIDVMLFLQRHMFRYLAEILPRLNAYVVPSFPNDIITQNAIQNYNNNNILDNLMLNENAELSIYQPQLKTKITNDDLEHTPFMRYVNGLMVERLVHMHPLCIFDMAILNLNEKIACYLKPTQITESFADFVRYFRAILFEIIYEYAKSSDCKQAYLDNPRKLKVKTLCHAEFFTTKRHTPPEFRCVASSAAACPHINDIIMADGKVPLKPNNNLCVFLIRKYIEDYPDDNKINTLFGFRCRFQDHDLSGDRNEPKEKIFAFYNIFTKTNNIHRMCIPDHYLSTDWFKWVISLLHL